MYAKAIVEVLEVIDHMEPELTSKIPSRFLLTLSQNADPDYVFEYDEEKELAKQNLSEDAQIILGIIFLKFLATGEEKKEIEEMIKDNDNKLYDVFNNDRFKSKMAAQDITLEEIKTDDNMKELEKAVSLVKSEDKWYKRIINKIKEIFNGIKKA